ncbi:RIP metalloprotease [Nakamurella antarctica]|uniref:RIP metalloprotease n=1 Tax=Nakamurella antarctica TaxID=1902245 RepID=A0A3G8ZMU5_9ACTN|nr:site-2 protease family protein [Nakamurella antarctica]AZI58115.1 RIP metalloprotease [Nakamurella antarctica]
MLVALGVVLFVLGLLFSIAWHELGHLTFAKIFGVRTTQYMVGFGKTVWSRQKGETEYGIKAVPLGGYIRMVGMVPPGKDGRQRTMTTAQGPMGVFRQMIEDSRASDRAQVIDTIDDGRQFYQLHPFKRIIIMFAGPFMNLIFAVGLFAVILIGIGIPTAIPTVASVSACVIPATATRKDCLPTDPQTPAAAAGLQPGDRFVSFNGQTITDWDQMRALIAVAGDTTAQIVYERGGVEKTARVPVIATERNTYDDTGTQVTGSAIVGFLGVSPQLPYTSQSIGAVVTQTGSFIGRAASAVVQIPSRIPALWDSIFSGQKRDVNTPVGIVGAGRISGEILDLDTSKTEKLVLFLQLLAGFNMSLFLLNLLPLLPLDGGHILGAVLEWIKRGFAKVFKRPDPGPFDVAKLMPVAYVVAILFIGLTLLTLVADIVNPVDLFG